MALGNYVKTSGEIHWHPSTFLIVDQIKENQNARVHGQNNGSPFRGTIAEGDRWGFGQFGDLVCVKLTGRRFYFALEDLPDPAPHITYRTTAGAEKTDQPEADEAPADDPTTENNAAATSPPGG